MEEGLSKLIPKEKVPILKEVLESDSLKEYTLEGTTAKDMFSVYHQNGLKVMDQVNKNMSFNDGEVLLAAYPKTGNLFKILLYTFFFYARLAVITIVSCNKKFM